MIVQDNTVDYNEKTPEEYAKMVLENMRVEGHLDEVEFDTDVEGILELCRIRLHTPFFLKAYHSGIIYMMGMEEIIESDKITEEDLKELYRHGVRYSEDTKGLYYIFA